MIRLSDYFTPYQIRWIRNGRPVVVAEKSRRIGWTYASAFRAVERRLRQGTNLYFSSADLSAVREFVGECQRWARIFKATAHNLGNQVIDEQTGLTAFVLRFENGSRIVAGSSNPKFFRSKGGDADADEFAFHEEPRELYRAMQPAAVMWGHQLRVWSTHNGEGSFFNELVRKCREEGEKGRKEEGERGKRRDARVEGDRDVDGPPAPSLPLAPSPLPPSLHRVTLLDAVEQGLVERIKGLSEPDPIARAAFIEEVRASCPDEDAWNQEYLCQPGSANAALLSYPLIAACEQRGLEMWAGEGSGFRGQGSGPCASPSALTTEPRTLNPLYAGFDVGRKHDRSVLWVLERVGDVYWTRLVRVLADVNFTAQEDLLHALLRGRPIKRLCVDATGIGAMLGERLRQRWGHRVEPIHFTAPVKSELAMPLVRLMQDRLLRIPADADVREDLHSVRKIVTRANHVRLDAERDDGGHADRFWALALAHHAADDATVRLPQPVARKPVGW